MDRDEAIRLLHGADGGIAEWNRRRAAGDGIPDLSGADLLEANLNGADLSGVNLSRANLCSVNIAPPFYPDEFSPIDFTGARLTGARLTLARLTGAILTGADLAGADLTGAFCMNTIFANLDLSVVEGLDSVDHLGPSVISTSTLTRSRGRIPEAFLRGCGLRPWEVLSTSLYNPSLTPAKLRELQSQIFDAWTEGRSMISGCFFSYSWENRKFVDKLGARLEVEGISTWIDRNKMLAGPMQPQVWRAIQDYEVVILVLSKYSVQSDWVENELDMARSKEKAVGRPVLCPVTLDDAWEAKVEAKDGPGDPSRHLWRTSTRNLVVDFSQTRSKKAFEESFGKLLRGLKVHYGPADPPVAS